MAARCPECDLYLTVRGGRRMCEGCGEVFLRPSEAVARLMAELGAVDVTPSDPDARTGRLRPPDGQLGMDL